MNNNNIEDFIRNNREAFDDREAPSGLWSKIDAEVNPREEAQVKSIRKPWMFFLSGMAASLVLALAVVGGFSLLSDPHDFSQSDVMKEYEQVEDFYSKQINVKLSDIELNPTIQEDLEQLDYIYQELKAELLGSQHGNSQDILDALTENYQTKLQLIELIQSKQTAIKNKNPLNEI